MFRRLLLLSLGNFLLSLISTETNSASANTLILSKKYFFQNTSNSKLLETFFSKKNSLLSITPPPLHVGKSKYSTQLTQENTPSFINDIVGYIPTKEDMYNVSSYSLETSSLHSVSSPQTRSTFGIMPMAEHNNVTLVNLNITTNNDTTLLNKSTVTGNLTSSATNHTITLENSKVDGNVNITGTPQSLNLSESTIVGTTSLGNGNNTITLTKSQINSLSLSGTNNSITIDSSTILGTITIPSNISASSTLVLEKSTTKALSVETGMNIQINDSTVDGQISTRGHTNLTIQNSRVTGNFEQLNPVGSNVVVEISDSFIGGRIGLHNTSGSARVTVQNSTVQNGIGINAGVTLYDYFFTDSTMGALSLNGTTNVTATRSTLLNISGVGTTNLTATSSEIVDINVAGVNVLTIDADASTIANISGSGAVNITATNTSIANISGTGNLDITASQSSIANITAGGSATITATDTSIADINIAGAGLLNLEMKGISRFTGNAYALGTNAGSQLSLDGTIIINSGTNTTMTSSGTLNISATTTIEIINGTTSNTFRPAFSTINNSNTTKPTFILHVNPITGASSKLDFSGVTNYNQTNLIVKLIPNVTTYTNAPLENITSLIIASNHFTPEIENGEIILSGYDYRLVPSIAGTANHYDLQRVGISVINNGFSSTIASVHSLNTSIARSISSSITEKAQLHRTREGKKVLNDREYYFNRLSLQRNYLDPVKGEAERTFTTWAKTNYTRTQQEVQDLPTMTMSMLSALAGIDISSFPITPTFSIMGQVFLGYAYTVNSFDEVRNSNTFFDVTQNMLTFGGSLGAEWLIQNSFGKLFINTGAWYSTINNTLQSNKTIGENIWTSSTINFLVSAGYSYSIAQFIITPQLEFHYATIPTHTYISPDATLVEFKDSTSITGKFSLLLGYTTQANFTPYIRGTIEMPLVKAEEENAVMISTTALPNRYSFSEMVLTATGGLSFRKDIHWSVITLTGEVTALFAKTKGIDATLEVGLSF